MLINTLDLDDLIRAVGYLQKARPIGECRNPLAGVPPRLQQAGAHFKRRALAGDGLGCFCQGERDRMVRGDAAGRPFLQEVDFEWNALLPDLLEQGTEALPFGFQVLFGVEPPFDGERAGVGHDVEVRSPSTRPPSIRIEWVAAAGTMA